MSTPAKKEFSWNLLFSVTGSSFVAFSAILKLMHSRPGDIRFFMQIGIASWICFVFSFVAGLLANASAMVDD